MLEQNRQSFQVIGEQLSRELTQLAQANVPEQSVRALAVFHECFKRYTQSDSPQCLYVDLPCDLIALTAALSALRPGESERKHWVLTPVQISSVTHWVRRDRLHVTDLTIYNTKLPDFWIIKRTGYFDSDDSTSYTNWFFIGTGSFIGGAGTKALASSLI